MIKKTLLTFSIVAGLFGATAHAIESGENIAVLDVQSVFEGTDLAKDVARELKEKSQKVRTRIEKMDADLAKREQELRSKRAALSEEKFMDEVAELRRVSREYRLEFQSEQDKLTTKQRRLNKKITGEIKVVVEELAKEKKFKAVIGRAYLIFADDAVDITDEVVKRVNDNLNKQKDEEGL